MKILGYTVTTKLIILSICLFLLLLFLRWNSFSSPFERDEGEYAYSAWIMSTGKAIPYKDAFLQKPPMIIYTYLFSYLINPTELWPARVLAFVFIFLSALLVAAIVRKEYGSELGWVGAFLTVIALSSPFYTALSANTEVFLILPLLGVLLIYVLKKDKGLPKHWFLAGALSAISLLYKPIGLYLLAYIFIFWIIKSYSTNKNLTIIVKNVISALAGCILTSLIIILPFILKGVTKELVETAVVFNFHYAKMWGLGLGGFSLEIGRLFKYWWILPLSSLAFFIKRNKNGYFYLGLLGISVLSVFQSVIGHYYLLVLPFLILVTLLGINNISKLLLKFGKKVPVSVLGVGVIFLMLQPITHQFGLSPEGVVRWIYGDVNPFVEATTVAKKVQQMTSPDDSIFVGGSEPQIYYYAKRRSVTRFVITYPLNLGTALREKYQTEAIEEIKNNHPKVIVVSQRAMSGLWDENSPKTFINYFEKLVKENYQLVGGYVWTNKGGYWEDNPDKEELENSSYLVYKNK